jgi:hypothetical protein
MEPWLSYRQLLSVNFSRTLSGGLIIQHIFAEMRGRTLKIKIIDGFAKTVEKDSI